MRNYSFKQEKRRINAKVSSEVDREFKENSNLAVF